MRFKRELGLYLLILSASMKAADCPQWNSAEAERQVTALASEIWRHDTLYYQQNHPEISDAEYDALEQRLTQLQNCFPYLSVQRYQTEAQKGFLPHFAFMGSLKKANDENDVKRFLSKHHSSNLILQPKIDGIAVELIYRKGVLTNAITRGDGESGESIIHHLKHMPLTPQQLPEVIDVVLHGELFARLDLVDKKLLERYASARHLVAGQVNRNIPEPEVLKAIDFFPWRWINTPHSSDIETINALYRLGFKHPLKYTHNVKTLQEIAQWRQVYAERKGRIFLMDGIVVKSVDLASRNKLDNNSKYPDWALAWKFPAKTAVSTVTNIEFSKGKTGKVTPVLILAPVSIEGRTIRRVSLGSMNIFLKKNIKVGDQVSVMLKGSATPVFGGVVFRGNR